MIDAIGSSPAVEAVTLIGAVLVEAIVLYVGYGAVERVVGETLIERITNA